LAGAKTGLPFQIWGTTRAASGAALEELGIRPILLGSQAASKNDWQSQLQEVCSDAYVLVSFPPDGNSDQVFSDIVFAAKPKATVYISTTGVYGKVSGIIDEHSAVDEDDPRALVRLNAERVWAAQSVILRAPGLYDANSGLPRRLLIGSYRLPGDGSNFVSRIHLDDLATIIVKAWLAQSLSASAPMYVVGDLKPTSHLEVVSWLCNQLSLPLPESSPLSEVNPSLRGNRQICSAKVLSDLDVKLKFPTYVEGFTQCLENS
jgi:nucleoside-diphosphate-sugar epimerase